MTDQSGQLKKWSKWLEGDLSAQVHDLVLQVHIFHSWRDAVKVSTDESRNPGFLHNWTARNYLDSIAIGVRRLSDRDRRTRSLARLLEEVANESEHLTKEWWMARSLEDLEDLWEEMFHRLSDGEAHVQEMRVQEDLDRLVAACESIKAYVDKHVAHLDADRTEVEIPRIEEAHDAVVTIYVVYRRWYQIITGAALATVAPPRWEHVLATPWITMENANEISERRREEWSRLLREADPQGM